MARDVLSPRVRASVSYFKLSRTNEFIGVTGRVSQQPTITAFSQLEVSSRGFVDVDAASCCGFCPTLHGGLDYLKVAGSRQSVSTSIPVFGAGLPHP